MSPEPNAVEQNESTPPETESAEAQTTDVEEPAKSDKNSVVNTFKVAVLLSLVCSVAVSVVAVGLRNEQEKNKELFRKQNILQAASTLLGVENVGELSNEEKAELYEDRIEAFFVDLETGETMEKVTDPKSKDEITPDKFDAKTAAKDPAYTKPIEGRDIAGLQGRRETFTVAYRVKTESGDTAGYVLPIRGYGLWSTLWGFLALADDGETIRGITYYEHAETPGLGGEVDNAKWKAQWDGKQALDDDGEVVIQVVKGQANGPTEIDGLAGATITSQGVTNMLEYWLGPRGFGPFLEAVKSAEPAVAARETLQTARRNQTTNDSPREAKDG